MDWVETPTRHARQSHTEPAAGGRISEGVAAEAPEHEQATQQRRSPAGAVLTVLVFSVGAALQVAWIAALILLAIWLFTR